MNRTIVALLLVIVLLVGTAMYLFGQRSAGPAGGDDVGAAQPVDAGNKTKEVAGAGAGAKAEKAKLATGLKAGRERAKLERAVRVGTDGPYASACRGIGSVTNLPGGNDNFLSVREGPSVKARQSDKLGDDAPVFLCDQNEDGGWIGIVYQADGYVPVTDECRVEENVPSRRPYAGPCLSGWVSAKYIETRVQG